MSYLLQCFLLLALAPIKTFAFNDISPYRNNIRKPKDDYENIPLRFRIEAWALANVGYISRSNIEAGYKCADQVSTILRLAKSNSYESASVATLIEILQRNNWTYYARPRTGCVLYSTDRMPINRSHIGILVRSPSPLRQQILDVQEAYDRKGQESINEFLVLQAQFPFLNSFDKNIVGYKLNNWKKIPHPKENRPHLNSAQQNDLLNRVLVRFQNTQEGSGEYNVVHNQVAALRLGPADMDDLKWMASAKVLCPSN